MSTKRRAMATAREASVEQCRAWCTVVGNTLPSSIFQGEHRYLYEVAQCRQNLEDVSHAEQQLQFHRVRAPSLFTLLQAGKIRRSMQSEEV